MRKGSCMWAYVAMGNLQTGKPAELQNGQRVFCRPSEQTWSAKYPLLIISLREFNLLLCVSMTSNYVRFNSR